ncbi:amidophosphoribosyltransferase [Aliidiomarina maris]|uniref:Amidophosphoribosyltransferase n=1 Tax=Aliidiomarina maris TaxID=531312 RepID=A0A327WPV0_9GAMM|nr:amidophosphoribosyltransferase [Aliidiomarina maris]RAJ93959.1 hypothetical protein B0I24_11562 [Aliidiomarina maris]RUO27536.1 amidophosphoribosyltransferase [Aliidiomarina maris]
MNKFLMEANQFLSRNVPGYFHTDFPGAGQPGNPDFLYKIKNDPHHKWSQQHIRNALNGLNAVLSTDFPEILRQVEASVLTVCVVPRAKAESSYRLDQLLFKKTVGEYAHSTSGFIDGSNFIIRHTNTRTTHLRNPVEGFENDGRMPYRGIASDTCNFSEHIRGRDILLVDDIYTKTVNIDEDMVQALFDNRARSVVFYAIGNTPKRF